ncbi:MAG: DMT family transporter [Xanthobacteraceae bacterium]|nr:DMT family transporter [Xanthobacteraceae bacterium]
MADYSWLWIVFTIAAALAQTVRNALQRGLTATAGTAGATHVRFLFGLPFSVLFLAGIAIATKSALPSPDAKFFYWCTLGAVSQIFATALMLMAMQNRSFVVAIAYIKTEPVLVAIFGLAFLGDVLTLPVATAIVIATAGVIAMSWTPGVAAANSAKPALLGIVAGAFFALAAVGFRGAVLSLPDASAVLMPAAYTLVWSLAIQTALLSLWLIFFDRKSFKAILRAWKPSISAGFVGALASQFWFMAFAVATAASVRTLALIEVLFAQFVSQGLFSQKTTRREAAGILLLLAGIALLLWTHPN